MTILNWVASPERILVAVDTRASDKGDIFERSKMLLQPHTCMLIAGRGRIDYVGLLHWIAHTNGFGADDTLDNLEAMMDDAERMLSMQGVPMEPDAPQQILIAGLSKRLGCLVAVDCQRLVPGGPITKRASDGSLCPWEPYFGPAPDACSALAMLAAARRQVAHMKSEPSFGGRLILADMQAFAGERPGVVIRDMGELD